MLQIVHVNRLNPKTTEPDFERFCTRFGDVVECVIYPENDKLSKRSGYVKFASCQSAEAMYRLSREETFYIDQTSIDVEPPRESSNSSRKKSDHSQNPNTSTSPGIYTLNIQGQITDENELISYLNSKPVNIKLFETIDNFGQTIKTGAQVTFNDKDLVDKILKQNHEKYTIKLAPNNSPIKREHDQEQSIDAKRSKLSQTSHSSLTSHLKMITKLTDDIYEENERLKDEKSLLTITFNHQITRIKQLEGEKTDLIDALSKTHDLAKCLTTRFKLREDEHKTNLDESNRKISQYEIIIKSANNALLTAKNEIQRLAKQITTLETQSHELTDKYIRSELIHLDQKNDIEDFFLALKKNSN